MVQSNKLVIVITGTMTSGKGALSFFLINRGFKFIRHTQPILDYGLKRKLDMSNRTNWIKSSIEMKKTKGMDILSKLTSKEITEGERYVVSPVRYPSDIKYYKEHYNALILYIDSPFKDRYKRTLMKEIQKPISMAEFKLKDSEEWDPAGKDSEFKPNIKACKRLSDEIIINDKSLNELNTKLEKILRKYKIPDIEDTESYEDVHP